MKSQSDAISQDQGRGTGADFLQLDIGVAPVRERAEWLTGQLRTAIGDGRLAASTPMPATRRLAEELGVSRGVVVEAYRRLADEGHLLGRAGAGTVVSDIAAAGYDDPVELPRADLPSRADRGDFDLSPGIPDLAAFPRTAWLRAERAVLADANPADLAYGDPRGNAYLREVLSRWLGRSRGVRVSSDGIVVVAGVAQSLALLSRVLLVRDIDTIAVEEPGSRGAREQIEHWGIHTTAVEVDEQGIRVDLLPNEAGAAMLTPAHQFPTGVALAPQRRRELLDWASKGRLIIEDDYDAEHRYDRAPIPALQGAAPALVAHTGSTSKTLAPGMRLGWLVPPSAYLAELMAEKHAADLGSPALPQLVLAKLVEDGSYDKHLRAVRSRQRLRRNAVVTALARYAPKTEVAGLAAGLHLLVYLPDDVDDVAVCRKAESLGVTVHPLSWHRTRAGRSGIVLGYAAHTPDRLTEAVRRLAPAIRARR